MRAGRSWLEHGLGPVLPSTAGELLAHAGRVRRVAVDAAAGTVLAVDDTHPFPTGSDALWTVLDRLVAGAVVTRDLSSASYRVPTRLRRLIEHRDRTCVFPGCTVPRYCDDDHREPWPHGPTSVENCQCLCRRHHRAEQTSFTVTIDPDTGDTTWTTPDGRPYRRPPPTH